MEEIDKLKSLATRLVRQPALPNGVLTTGAAGNWDCRDCWAMETGTLRTILQSSDCLSTTQIPEAWLDSAASCSWHLTGMAMASHTRYSAGFAYHQIMIPNPSVSDIISEMGECAESRNPLYFMVTSGNIHSFW